MEKLKLTEKQKYILLQKSYVNIVSQGRNFTHFLSVYDCDSVKFNVGVFSRKNGCRVEIVYLYNNCTVRLLYHYVPITNSGEFISSYKFIPKALTIDREFKGSVLISIVPDDSCHELYVYQSTKSIYQLCVGDSEEGEGVAVGQGSVCPAGESSDSPLPNDNKHSVTSQLQVNSLTISQLRNKVGLK